MLRGECFKIRPVDTKYQVVIHSLLYCNPITIADWSWWKVSPYTDVAAGMGDVHPVHKHSKSDAIEDQCDSDGKYNI